jgi:hypothetical protein
VQIKTLLLDIGSMPFAPIRAMLGEEEIGYMRVVFKDLPVALTFPDAVAAFEACGRRVASFSKLEMRASKKALHVLMLMARAAASVSSSREITDLLVECHPRHAKLYSRLFGMKQLGVERKSVLADKPAVLMHAPVADLVAKVAL